MKRGKSGTTFSESAYLELKLLLISIGCSNSLATYLVHAGQENGHNGLKRFIHLTDEGPLQPNDSMLAEKIVHLADDMTSTGDALLSSYAGRSRTLFLPPTERVAVFKLSRRYPSLWQERLGANSGGKILHVPDVNSPEVSTPGKQVRLL
jgi:hypothetical protein